MCIVTTKVRSVEQLIEASWKARREVFHHPLVWWRGQPKSEPESESRLLPRFYRLNNANVEEASFSALFTAQAPVRYPNCPPEHDIAAWLFLMQHYGVPTRLLDWTESILIAAYFAIYKEPESSATVWGLCPTKLNADQFPGKVTGDKIFTTHGIESMIKPAFRSDAPNEEKVAALSPKQVDVRMLIQLSTFTIHGTRTPLQEMANSSQFLFRIDIPADAKTSIGGTLSSLGIKDSNLFPDLEHLARQIGSSHPL